MGDEVSQLSGVVNGRTLPSVSGQPSGQPPRGLFVGIINGCTNFILSNMAQGGLSYSDALKEASARASAEAEAARHVLPSAPTMSDMMAGAPG